MLNDYCLNKTCKGCKYWAQQCIRIPHRNTDINRPCSMYRYENKLSEKEQNTLNYRQFASRLAVGMERTKITKFSLAALVGVSEEVVNDWLSGKVLPTQPQMKEIAILVYEDVEWLMPKKTA